jgi:hypothetical protein
VEWQLATADGGQSGTCLRALLDPFQPRFPRNESNASNPALDDIERSLIRSEGDGCEPSPSFTSVEAQPLYSMAIDERTTESYSYVAGTVDPRASDVLVSFDDGTTETVSSDGGVFIVVFRPTKKVATLKPQSPLAPSVKCHLQPATPNVGIGNYADAGCS